MIVIWNFNGRTPIYGPLPTVLLLLLGGVVGNKTPGRYCGPLLLPNYLLVYQTLLLLLIGTNDVSNSPCGVNPDRWFFKT